MPCAQSPFVAWKTALPLDTLNGPIAGQSADQLAGHPLAPGLRVSAREVMRLVADSLVDPNPRGWMGFAGLQYDFFARLTMTVSTHPQTQWRPQTWRILRRGDFVRPRGEHRVRATVTCLCARVLGFVTITGFAAEGLDAPPGWLQHTVAEGARLRSLKAQLDGILRDEGLGIDDISVQRPRLHGLLQTITAQERGVLIIVEYLTGSPGSTDRDDIGRPMCASLPYNHAVWTWDTLPGGNSRHLLRDATCQQRVARLAGVTTDSVAQESRRRIGIHTADNILYKVAMGRDYDCEAGWIETISISTGRNSTRPMFRPGAGAAHYFENDTEDESDTE